MTFMGQQNVYCNRTNREYFNQNCTDDNDVISNFADFAFNVLKTSDEFASLNNGQIAVVLLVSLVYVLLLPFDSKMCFNNFFVKSNAWIANNCDSSKGSFIVVCLITFIVSFPLVVFLLLLAFLYREIVRFDIKRKCGKHFMGFLEGTDALWALEDDISRSVINVMALIKVTPDMQLNGDPSTQILMSLRKRISERLLVDDSEFPKLFYKRCKEYGFPFWTDENDCNIEEFIRFVPAMDPIDGIEDNTEYTEQIFSALANTRLLYNHSASWEFLIAQRLLQDGPDEEKSVYNPILIRMHHSLGDGVSLLRFFLEIVADKSADVPLTINGESQPTVPSNSNEEYAKSPVLLENSISKGFQSITSKLKTLLKSPATLIYQAVFHQIDKNSLHSQTLSGEKIVCWRFERDADNNLMNSIKSIKRQSRGARFSDVILTALSLSFEAHFEAYGNSVPKSMTVVHIARFAPEGPMLKLQNRFSVGLQKLPIRSTNDERTTRFYSQLSKVHEHSERLRNSPDFFVNYWVISFLTCLLPDNILASIIESVHSTIAISNLPGPQHTTNINGFEIENITFWVPNRGSTGIGLSILSYGNKLQFGLIADRAAISKLEDARDILENMVDEIKCISAYEKRLINNVCLETSF